MKPTQEKTKIGIEINENNLTLKKTENDIFDNNYYKIKYKLSQNEYDENLVKTLLELLNSKQFCFIEPLLISYNLRSIFISTGKHSPIKEEDKNLICKIIIHIFLI